MAKKKKPKLLTLMSVRSPKIIWDYGVPLKKSEEYGIEYCFFDIIFKDKRRRGCRILLCKREVKDLIKAFNFIKKYYKKQGEPKWKGSPVPMTIGFHKDFKKLKSIN